MRPPSLCRRKRRGTGIYRSRAHSLLRWSRSVLPLCSGSTSVATFEPPPDAGKPYIKDGCADLVFGAAILRHLVEPGKFIASALRVVRPGGSAFFFESFEGGLAILRLILHEVGGVTKSLVIQDGFQPRASNFVGRATSGRPILCQTAPLPRALRNSSIHFSGKANMPGGLPKVAR
jgi:hypothetical protein